MNHSDTKPQERKTLTVIVFKRNDSTQFHFANGDFARTQNDRELWIEATGDLFTSIENFLIMNREANNVTAVNELRQINDICTDYEVIYNPFTA